MDDIGGLSNRRVMLDRVARYGTVTVEAEAPVLAEFEAPVATTANRPEIRQAMARNMDLVEEGDREVYRPV